jgi:hypothetical protein
MKLLNVLLVISLLSLFNSCKKDEQEPIILGKWYPQSAVQTLFENGNEYTTTTYIASEKTFYADGTGLMTLGDSYSNSFNWKLEGDVLTITQLSVYGTSTTSKWSVLSIDANSLQIKNTFKQSSSSNQEIITESIETYGR